MFCRIGRLFFFVCCFSSRPRSPLSLPRLHPCPEEVFSCSNRGDGGAPSPPCGIPWCLDGVLVAPVRTKACSYMHAGTWLRGTSTTCGAMGSAFLVCCTVPTGWNAAPCRYTYLHCRQDSGALPRPPGPCDRTRRKPHTGEVCCICSGCRPPDKSPKPKSNTNTCDVTDHTLH